MAGSVLQAASLTTIDAESHIFVRLARHGQQNEFVKRYGDTGEDEFDGRGGTIPQRLLLMNGELVRERIEARPVQRHRRGSPGWRPNDPKAVEVAYLAILLAPADAGGGRPLRAVPRRQRRSSRAAAAGRPVLGADQLDGVLMEPLTPRPLRPPRFLALARPGRRRPG